ncbi:hypothetical protein GE061_018310 [Apolygus lucorum]|uniref:Uncharacterized protein n=1 Tax=Apolygus lucorum TaxID=248454 RepID=A0A8S9XFK6_APOLU|nr:hypothetical protein GE061_018310 [Apolygus lucorum]
MIPVIAKTFQGSDEGQLAGGKASPSPRVLSTGGVRGGEEEPFVLPPPSRAGPPGINTPGRIPLLARGLHAFRISYQWAPTSTYRLLIIAFPLLNTKPTDCDGEADDPSQLSRTITARLHKAPSTLEHFWRAEPSNRKPIIMVRMLVSVDAFASIFECSVVLGDVPAGVGVLKRMEDGIMIKEEPTSEEEASEDQVMYEVTAIKLEVLIGDERAEEEATVGNISRVEDEVAEPKPAPFLRKAVITLTRRITHMTFVSTVTLEPY